MPTGNPFTSASAPQQQLMGSPYTEEQANIFRQQQLADLLRKQSMDPLGDTQMVSGWAVKRSPLEGAAKLAQALGANWTQSNADQKSKDLGERYKNDLAATLNQAQQAMQGSPEVKGQDIYTDDYTAVPKSDQEGYGAKSAVPGSTMGYYEALMKHPATQGMGMQGIQSEMQTQRLAQILKNAGGGGDGSVAGVNPIAMKLALTPGGEKLGTMVQDANKPMALREGDLVNPATGQSLFAQPKLAPGMQPIRNAQGQVIGAQPIPNYAEGAAGIKGAEERARADYDMITVDTPNGPKMMTKAQAAAQAGGKPAVADMRGDPAKILRDIASISDPVERDAALKAYATNNQPGASGIPLQDEGSKQFSKTIAEKSGTDLLESRDKAKTAIETIQGIEQARQAIKGGAFQSTGADMKLGLTKFINANIPGVSIDEAKAGNTDYLKSILGTGLLQQAKTLGSNPSNADATRINDIVGSIGKDPKAMDKILDWRQQMAEQAITRHNNTVDDAESRGMKSPYDLRVKPAQKTASASPSAVRKFNPVTGKIE